MIKSMTAYGRGEFRQGETTFVAEIRSVNSRYRDVVLRLPRNLQGLEEELRRLISSRVLRGRVEVSIQMEDGASELPDRLELNVPLVESYLKIIKEAASRFGLDQEMRLDTLLQMKDVILYKADTPDVETLKPAFIESLSRALDSLDAMRRNEGKAIEADFDKRLRRLEEYASEIRKRAPSVVAEYRERLRENVKAILVDQTVDEVRLAQEVAIFAERSDVTEEVVRINSHLNQFRHYLSKGGSVGRRLDFLIQEIHREVNTLSTKASDFSISKMAVEMKAELEKLREQVQNVE